MASARHCLTVLLLLAAPLAHAQARFDLTGPPIDVKVTRGDKTLPIAQVPNLMAGDTLWVHPQLPPSQSVHYLLVVAFLRGTTNPPPDQWFTRIQTWDRNVRDEGAWVTVPAEAQQALMFLAPETGGDFTTLRSAVKGRPGLFVRASTDLAEAGFEQARINKYFDAMKQVPPGDSKALQEHSDLLARTLNLKPNPDCFRKPLDLQYSCLTQTGTQMLLDDGHGQSMLATFSGGDSANLIGTASATSLAGGGLYSAYVGTIVDFVHIMDGLHTAKYQYLPSIAFPDTASAPESLNLKLNTPPSFINPKSVIVIALPAVQQAVLPPLRPVDASHISCLLDPRMVLPIDGAPLVFSTSFAHNLALHVQGKEIPLAADAFEGGLIVSKTPDRKELPVESTQAVNTGTKPDPKPGPKAKPEAKPADGIVSGTIDGQWGFDPFKGPSVQLQEVPGSGWRIVTAADTNLIIGQPNHLQVAANGTACIRSIALEPGDTKVDWKLAPAKNEGNGMPSPPVELTVNLPHAATPGSIHLAIQQFGEPKPDEIGTRTFSEPAKIDGLQMHAEDTSATLTGINLDQVKIVTLKDLTYSPQCGERLDESCGHSPLQVSLAKDVKNPAFKPGEKLTAEVHLIDGRTVLVSTTVLPPRPTVKLLNSRVSQASASPIQLTGQGDSGKADLPLGAKLTFFLKSKTNFPRDEQIELANQDETLQTTLSVASGALILEDSHTVLANFDPLKTFGPSTFGPLRLRAIAPDGARGDWLPLATVVRLPTLTNLHCPADSTQPCDLNGSDLYLINAVALDPGFINPTEVPDGFVDPSVKVPRVAVSNPPPATTTVYVKLRDDPNTVHPAIVPLQVDVPGAVGRVRGGSALASPATPKTAATSLPVPPPPTL